MEKLGKRKNSSAIVFVFCASGVNRGGSVYTHLSDLSFVMTNRYAYAERAEGRGVI